MNITHIGPAVLGSLGGLFAILVAASTAHLVLKKARPQTDFTEIGLRIRSWWVMVSKMVLSMVFAPGVHAPLRSTTLMRW